MLGIYGILTIYVFFKGEFRVLSPKSIVGKHWGHTIAAIDVIVIAPYIINPHLSSYILILNDKAQFIGNNHFSDHGDVYKVICQR